MKDKLITNGQLTDLIRKEVGRSFWIKTRKENLLELETYSEGINFDNLEKLSKLFETKTINIGSDIDLEGWYYPSDNPNTVVAIFIWNPKQFYRKPK